MHRTTHILLLALFLYGGSDHLYAQPAATLCGAAYLHSLPRHSQTARPSQPRQKLNAGAVPVIPVVFHLLLDTAQQARLGGPQGLKRCIDSQMAFLNRDFQAAAADTAQIPPAFRPLLGKAGIGFALACRTPDGTATPGYEIRTMSRKGFETIWSGVDLPFTEAKHAASGGLDAWDPSVYLNIWLINPLEKGRDVALLGFTLPLQAVSEYGIPQEETGIVLGFQAWTSYSRGRALVHEAGHFLGLKHTWGDDDGRCAGSGGADDGIADTPPQAKASSGCPSFPVYDACSPAGDGIMYVNFMDYSHERCALMFSQQQAAFMQEALMPGAAAYSLTLHPDVLQPVSETDPAQVFHLYPNPSAGKVYLVFPATPSRLEGVQICNALGQVVAQAGGQPRGYYLFDLGKEARGLYYVWVQWRGHRDVRKIILY